MAAGGEKQMAIDIFAQIESRDHIVEAWLLRSRCARPGRSAKGDSVRGIALVQRWRWRTCPET